MTSRSRIAWASVAMTLAVLLGASTIVAASPAVAADEPVPAFSVDVQTAPRTAPGGTWVRATVTVTARDAEVYPDALVSVAMDWDTTRLSVGTGSEHGVSGCLLVMDPVTMVSAATPTPGDECVLDVPRDPLTPAVFTYWFQLLGVPPALPVVTAQVTGGYLQDVELFSRVDFDAADLTSDEDYLELAPVFSAGVTVDRRAATTGIGDTIVATFTVTHEPDAAPRTASSQVLFAINWPAFLAPVGGTTPADACDGGLVAGLCAITEPTNVRRTTVFTMAFNVPPGNGGQGAISIIGQGGWYTPPGPVIALAPRSEQPSAIRVVAASDVHPAIVKAAPTPRPEGALDIPGTWTGVDAASVVALDRPFPMEVELRPKLSTLGDEQGIEGVIRVSHAAAAAVTLFGLELDVALEFDAALVPTGDPVGCATYIGGVCTITGLDEPGSEAVITVEFAPPAEIGVGYLDADQDAARFDFDGAPLTAPDGWLEHAYDSQITDAELVTLDVDLTNDYVWEDGPYLGARVTVTRAERGDDGDLYDELVVGVAITWPAYLTPVADPSGCVSWDGLVCEVVLPDPGPEGAVMITLTFAIGPGVVDGVVRAEGAYLLEDRDEGEDRDLPVEWVVPGEAPVAGVDPFITLDVALDRELVWQGGHDVAATITVTREAFAGARRDPFGELIVGVAITWPAFLHPNVPPTGCESWDGAICDVLLSKPGSVAQVGLEFSVAGSPDGSVLPGVVRAEADSLGGADSDLVPDLPVDWVAPDEAPVTRVRPAITLDLADDHDPGYTGGKQLVLTTVVTRETPGAVLPGLEIGLDYTWAGYLTKTSDAGCASFSGTTCVVTGLDQPGASAVVTLTFSMPAPTLPPVPPVAPRTDDLVVDGVALSFDAPVVELPSPTLAPEPLPAALPPSWIGEDREPFTVLQPNLRMSPAVTTPGEVIGAIGTSLPPNAAVTFHWDGVPTDTPSVRWPGSGDPTSARWALLVLRWELPGIRTLVMHSVDGLFGDIPSSNRLLVAPRSAMAPNLLGRGG
ncbi:hypothetical protein J2X63_001060 [Agromyces sp. 3263]|uniref:hypothetical protein n=1 Tax=Agromyces sp. 3263 TaxID=2817750 RepID=UPI002858B1ED|nr:hypothetical protein [Agromyces sp. 3263]MDR6905374.1 hypothetical protein [Agromyces sp. 3263]